MKGKVIRGRGFRGCLNYLLRHMEGPVQGSIIGGNMLGQNPEALAKEFAHVRRIRPDCKRPVLHVPLRMPDGEDVPEKTWREIAARYLKLMKLSPDRPWILVKHPDQHIHILTSRISWDGDIWLGHWEALEHISATQKIEREFGLTITPGLEGDDAKQVRLTSGQLAKFTRQKAKGEPEPVAKILIAEHIEEVLAECDGTFDDLEKRLLDRGVNIQLNRGKTGPITGISYEWQKVAIPGSKVARAYSWLGLNKLLKERKKIYESERNPKPDEAASTRTNPARGIAPADPATGEHLAPAAPGVNAGPEVSVPEIPVIGGDRPDPAPSGSDRPATIPDQRAPEPVQRPVPAGDGAKPGAIKTVPAADKSVATTNIAATNEPAIEGDPRPKRTRHPGHRELDKEARGPAPTPERPALLTPPAEEEEPPEKKQSPPARGR